VDDSAVIDGCEEKMIRKLNLWKEGLEKKGLGVNLDKSKQMIVVERHNILRNVGNWLCVVYGKGVGCTVHQMYEMGA